MTKITSNTKITTKTVDRAMHILMAIVGNLPFDPAGIDSIPIMTPAEKECAKTWVYLHAVPTTDERVIFPA